MKLTLPYLRTPAHEYPRPSDGAHEQTPDVLAAIAAALEDDVPPPSAPSAR